MLFMHDDTRDLNTESRQTICRILFIHAPWCPACAPYIKVLQEVEKEEMDKVTIDYMNYDSLSEAELSEKSIKGVPLIRFLQHGEQIFQEYGGNYSKSQLKALIQAYFQY
jgi:thiol-disulfide isomerase/thioredoxin